MEKTAIILIILVLLLVGLIGCVPTEAEPSCYDTDDNNIYTWGYVVGTDFLGGYFEHEDYCIGNEVREFWCEGNEVKQERFVCNYGCEGGKCNPEEGCINPKGNLGEFYCDNDGLIFKCTETTSDGWSLAEEPNYCPINHKYSFNCLDPNTVKSSKEELCELADLVCSNDNDCYDGDACTLDSCTNGKCTFSRITCKSGEYCSEGQCTEFPPCETDLDCDDNNIATDDKCIDNKCQNKSATHLYAYIIGVIALILFIIVIIYFVKSKKRRKK